MFWTKPQVAALQTLRGYWRQEQVVIIGAAAIQYHLGHEWRLTDDLDLSIATSVEEHADVLSSLPGWARDSRMEQRWLAPGGVRIDVIPASDDAIAVGEIVWPDSGFRMSLRGFALAFKHGEPVELSPGVSALIASLPTLVVLKMAAYLDRPAERERDLADLAVILEKAVADDDEDRYSEEAMDADLTFEEDGPFVLGQRVARVVRRDERGLLAEFLLAAENADEPPFILRKLAKAGPTAWNGEIAAARMRLDGFERGVTNVLGAGWR